MSPIHNQTSLRTLTWALPITLTALFVGCAGGDTGPITQNNTDRPDTGTNVPDRSLLPPPPDAGSTPDTGIPDGGDPDTGTTTVCSDAYDSAIDQANAHDFGQFVVKSKSDTHQIPSLAGASVSLGAGDVRVFKFQTTEAGGTDRPDSYVYINGDGIKSTVEFVCDNGGESRLNCFGDAEEDGNSCVATTTGTNVLTGGQIACSSKNNYTAIITLEAPNATGCTSANLRVRLTQ